MKMDAELNSEPSSAGGETGGQSQARPSTAGSPLGSEAAIPADAASSALSDEAASAGIAASDPNGLPAVDGRAWLCPPVSPPAEEGSEFNSASIFIARVRRCLLNLKSRA